VQLNLGVEATAEEAVHPKQARGDVVNCAGLVPPGDLLPEVPPAAPSQQIESNVN